MNDDNKKEPKRNIPGGFLVFLLAIVLLILTFQGISTEKSGKVAFSHEAEHLVNLDLIQPQDSRKIALNENLVTFSGRFRDHLTDDAKNRYRYLELLNRNHELTADNERLNEETVSLHKQVADSAAIFLKLSGLPIPKGGYRVVDAIYNTPTQENAILIKDLDRGETVSLADLQKNYQKFSEDTQTSQLDDFGKQLLFLVQGFRSPALGIGSEPLKAQMKTLEQKVTDANASAAQGVPVRQRLSDYREVLGQLDLIVGDLDKEQQNMRLLPLRSVRNYKEDLTQLSMLGDELEKNEAQLDKARQAVASCHLVFQQPGTLHSRSGKARS